MQVVIAAGHKVPADALISLCPHQHHRNASSHDDEVEYSAAGEPCCAVSFLFVCFLQFGDVIAWHHVKQWLQATQASNASADSLLGLLQSFISLLLLLTALLTAVEPHEPAVLWQEP